jgi:hypothetical protein
MRTLRAAATLAFAILVCAAGGATPSRAGELALFPYEFKCPARWKVEKPGPISGLTWCSVARRGDEAFSGELRLFALDWCPAGSRETWAAAKGAILPISQYTALFSLISTTFGGNGTDTFALPNVPNTPAHMTWCIALDGIWPPHP